MKRIFIKTLAAAFTLSFANLGATQESDSAKKAQLNQEPSHDCSGKTATLTRFAGAICKRAANGPSKPPTSRLSPNSTKNNAGLVQMEEADGILLTGVHDQEDGTVQSGWVAIDSGVEQDRTAITFIGSSPPNPKLKPPSSTQPKAIQHTFTFTTTTSIWPMTRKMALRSSTQSDCRRQTSRSFLQRWRWTHYDGGRREQSLLLDMDRSRRRQ